MENSELTITPEAVVHIQKSLAGKEALGVRLHVKKAGCSGYEYVIEYAYEIEPTDKVFEQDGVKVVVDGEIFAKYIHGTIIEFKKEGVNAGLEFNNPNVEAVCGCGESFSLTKA